MRVDQRLGAPREDAESPQRSTPIDDEHNRPTTHRVSVIIPCRNQGHFLPEAIRSVLLQNESAETIVVDDGSTDSTRRVAESFPGVLYIAQRHSGLSAARNAGLARASGQYVVFLDADDRLRPGALRTGLDVLTAQPEVAFVAGHYAFIDATGRVESAPPQKRLTDDPYRALLHDNVIGMHGTVLFRRAAVVDAGGHDPTLEACEDYDLYLRIAQHHHTTQHSSVVAEYRRHASNMSKDPSLMLREALRVLDRHYDRVASDPALARAHGEGRINWTRHYLGQMREEVWQKADSRALGARLARALTRRAQGLSRARHLVQDFSLHGRRVFSPRVGRVRMGHLRRLSPISTTFGYDRGRPVDRYYIEAFLGHRATDVGGRVLEIGDASYTHQFGRDRVTCADVLHITADNPEATFVGSLESGAGLPSAAFDCIILTQTLHLIFDVRAALKTVERALRPGGVLLATVPGISQVDRDEWGLTWSWAITPYALARLMSDAFPGGSVTVESHGNVLTSTAFLHGLTDAELRPWELDYHDPAYPMLSTARVVKAHI